MHIFKFSLFRTLYHFKPCIMRSSKLQTFQPFEPSTLQARNPAILPPGRVILSTRQSPTTLKPPKPATRPYFPRVRSINLTGESLTLGLWWARQPHKLDTLPGHNLTANTAATFTKLLIYILLYIRWVGGFKACAPLPNNWDMDKAAPSCETQAMDKPNFCK